jgi:hypothetical protein
MEKLRTAAVSLAVAAAALLSLGIGVGTAGAAGHHAVRTDRPAQGTFPDCCPDIPGVRPPKGCHGFKKTPYGDVRIDCPR